MKKVNILDSVVRVFLTIILAVLFVIILGGVYTVGFYQGVQIGQSETENYYSFQVSSLLDAFTKSQVQPTPVIAQKIDETSVIPSSDFGYIRNSDWGGPDLWNAVNKRRQELGVNSLNQRDDLCTIASIRLNELLELGKLDGHEGFSNMTERRPDLENILDRYSTVAEFLAAGGDSAEQTISMWENSLGHRKLLTGGEYVWGCIYAQNSFAVAITAF